MEEEKNEKVEEKVKVNKKGSKMPLIIYIIFYLLISVLCLYASDMSFNFNKLTQVLLLIVVPLLFTFINFCVFLRHNVKALDDLEKDYYPELKTNSMEFGASLAGKTDKSDITSLVLYLARERYLNLGTKKLEDGSITYKLTKLRDYDGSEDLVKEFFNKLFEEKDEISREEIVGKIKKIVPYLRIEQNKRVSDERFSTFIASHKLSMVVMIAFTYFLFMGFGYVFTNVFSSWLYLTISSVFILFLCLLTYKGTTRLNFGVSLIIMVATRYYFINYLGTGEAPVVTDIAVIVYTIYTFLNVMAQLLLLSIYNPRSDEEIEKSMKVRKFKNGIFELELEDVEFLRKTDEDYLFNVLPYAESVGLGNRVWDYIKALDLKCPYYESEDMNFVDFFDKVYPRLKMDIMF